MNHEDLEETKNEEVKKRKTKFTNACERKQHYKDEKYNQKYYHDNVKKVICAICQKEVYDRCLKKHNQSFRCKLSYLVIQNKLQIKIEEINKL